MKNDIGVLLRPIQTSFYNRKELVKTNHAKHANSAVLRCVDHMQLNHYGATTAEVFDNTTGELHAVFKYDVTGTISIVFKRTPREGM